MASFNKVILMGRLTADPELKQVNGGTSVTSFTVAVDRKYTKGEEKQADFISVVAWRQTAEFICKYFSKGSAILVEGELQTRSWTDQQGNKRYATEVVAHEVSFCEAKKNSETNDTAQNQNAAQGGLAALSGYMPDAYKPAKSASVDFEPVTDDNLPF
jgi:single-strand DNA-binding protein